MYIRSHSLTLALISLQLRMSVGGGVIPKKIKVCYVGSEKWKKKNQILNLATKVQGIHC